MTNLHDTIKTLLILSVTYEPYISMWTISKKRYNFILTHLF